MKFACVLFLVVHSLFLIALPACSRGVITEKDVDMMNEELRMQYISTLPERFPVNMEREDGRGVRIPFEAEMKVLDFAAREHMVHYSPGDRRPGEYDFLLNLEMEYEVIEPAPVFLSSDDSLSYWRIRNRETGRRGALFSGEKLDLSEKGVFSTIIPVYRAFKHVEKGTGIITRHHWYAVHDAVSGEKISYTRFHILGSKPWEITEYNTGEMAFYPGLLFLVADLSEFSLSLEEPSYSDCGRLAVRLSITDAAGDKFYLPRADVKAEVTVPGGREVVELSPAFHPHAVPKNYFEGFIPGGGAPEEASFSARVSFVNPEGRSEARFVRADFRAGEFTPYAEEVHEPHQGEIRALFQHTGWVGSREGVDETIKNMKRANMNMLLAQYHRRGGVAWKSSLERPYSDELDFEKFDPVAYAIEQGNASGIEVHATINAYRYSPIDGRTFRNRVSVEGRENPASACPHDAEYQDYIAEVVRELCIDYDIDGVNLDVIRTGEGCFCEECERMYQAEHGVSLRADYFGNYPYPERFTEWNERGVTALVRKIHNVVKDVDGGIKMSICAYTLSSPGERDMTTQGQPAHVWLEEGLLDFVVPMIYDHYVWESVIRAKEYLEHAPSPEQVVPIIRLLEAFTFRFLPDIPLGGRRRYLWNRHPDNLLVLVEAARREGFRNIAFYFGGWLVDEHIEALADGPFKEKSAPYWAL